MHLTVSSALVGLALFAAAITPTVSVASPEQVAAAGEDRGYSAAYRSCMSSGDAADGVTSAVLD